MDYLKTLFFLCEESGQVMMQRYLLFKNDTVLTIYRRKISYDAKSKLFLYNYV